MIQWIFNRLFDESFIFALFLNVNRASTLINYVMIKFIELFSNFNAWKKKFLTKKIKKLSSFLQFFDPESEKTITALSVLFNAMRICGDAKNRTTLNIRKIVYFRILPTILDVARRSAETETVNDYGRPNGIEEISLSLSVCVLFLREKMRKYQTHMMMMWPRVAAG